MNISLIGSASENAQTALYGVSTDASTGTIVPAWNALVDAKGNDVLSWSRVRHEYTLLRNEQLFVPANKTAPATKEIWNILRNVVDAQFCTKGARPTVKAIDKSMPNTRLVDYLTNYSQILPWRFRISCLLSLDREKDSLSIERETLRVVHLRYGPFEENEIVSKASERMFDSRGTEHFSQFVNACNLDPVSIGVPSGGENPARILRRTIRKGLESLLQNRFIRESFDPSDAALLK